RSGQNLTGTLATVNEVSLNHDENSVGWDYHAVNLENPSAVQYAYQLEGLHDDWVYAGTQRAVNFPNLPSGKYEFRLRASTDGEHWSVLASPFTLLIATPWWQSWWAYVIYALLLVAALWVLYSNQRQRWQLATQAQRLELMEKEKEAANLQSMLLGQEAERQRLSKDLHDGMGSILSNLKATFTYLWANKNDATAENYFNQTTEMINYASSEIRKISHDLMPGALERFGLVAAVQDLAQQMRTLHGLEVNLEIINLEQRPDRQTELMLFRIIQELSNNIIKYASANEVLLQLVQMEDQLSLVIEDDGVGFDLTKVENTQNGMGLRSVRSRVSFLKGELDIFSERGKGSTFSIQIPFKV
ncbi:MAG: triple tyrosine motif-containing protein, partial [Bacteroidota bacterium]